MQTFKPALFAHSWGSKERQDQCRKGPALTIFTQREHCWLTVSGLFLGGLHCSWGPFHGTVSKAKGNPWTGVIVKAFGGKTWVWPSSSPLCPPPSSEAFTKLTGDAGCCRCPLIKSHITWAGGLTELACFGYFFSSLTGVGKIKTIMMCHILSLGLVIIICNNDFCIFIFPLYVNKQSVLNQSVIIRFMLLMVYGSITCQWSVCGFNKNVVGFSGLECQGRCGWLIQVKAKQPRQLLMERLTLKK